VLLYSRKRYLDTYGSRETPEKEEDFRQKMREILSCSRSESLNGIKDDMDFYPFNFLDFLNYDNIDKTLSKLSSFTLSQAYITAGVLFSDRPDSFYEAEKKVNKGYSFCYFQSKAVYGGAKGRKSYTGSEDIDFGVIKGETLYRFKRYSRNSSLILPIREQEIQIDLTNVVKMITNFTSKERCTLNPSEAISRDLKASDFSGLVSDKKKHYVFLKGKNAVLAPGRFIPDDTKVLPWSIVFKDSQAKKKKWVRHESDSTELKESPMGLRVVVAMNKTPVYQIRDGLFFTKDVFFRPKEPNSFVVELEKFFSQRIFVAGGFKARISSLKEAIKYEVDSDYFRNYYADKYPGFSLRP